MVTSILVFILLPQSKTQMVETKENNKWHSTEEPHAPQKPAL